MAKQTTVKPIGLGYRNVASSGDYTKLMGVLKGLTIGQDDPDSTEIEAEFYDAPFDIFYDGNPVTMTFELANYDLSELPALFGGTYNSETNEYEGATNAYTSEHEWKLDFGRGNAALVIVRGLTIGTLKKDADGALNFNVTITALVHTDTNQVEHMYRIVGVSQPSTLVYAQLTIDDDDPVNIPCYGSIEGGFACNIGNVAIGDGISVDLVFDESLSTMLGDADATASGVSGLSATPAFTNEFPDVTQDSAVSVSQGASGVGFTLTLYEDGTSTAITTVAITGGIQS